MNERSVRLPHAPSEQHNTDLETGIDSKFLNMMALVDKHFPKIRINSQPKPKFKKQYMFRWGEIPGKDTPKLHNVVGFVEPDLFSSDGLKISPLPQKIDCNTIYLKDSRHDIKIVLHSKNTKVSVLFDDKKTLDYDVTVKDGALTAYKIVEKKIKTNPLRAKITKSLIVICIFYFLAETPRLGIPVSVGDPLHTLGFPRILFASSYGSLMELGIAPLLLGMIIVMIIGAIIGVKYKIDPQKGIPKQVQSGFRGSYKVWSLVSTILVGWLTVVYVGCGEELTAEWFWILMLQFIAVSFVLLLLLDFLAHTLFHANHSLGHSDVTANHLLISLYMASTLVWIALNPFASEASPYGFVFDMHDKLIQNQPLELFGPTAVSGLFEFVWLVGLIPVLLLMAKSRIDIPVVSTKFRGFSGVYPVNFLYVSLIPISLTLILFNMIKFGHVVFLFDFEIIKRSILEPCKAHMFLPEIEPSPIFNVLSPPTMDVWNHSALDGIAFVIVFFAVYYIMNRNYSDTVGMSAKGAANRLLDADVQIPSFRRSNKPVEALLNKYIPNLMKWDVIFITIIIVISSAFDLMGKTLAMFFLVGFLLYLSKTLKNENIEVHMPRLAKILGLDTKPSKSTDPKQDFY